MDFVYFSPIEWDDQGGAHRPTQISLALAAAGHRILFIQIPPFNSTSPHPNIELTSLTQLGLPEKQIRRVWFGFDEENPETVVQNLTARLNAFEKSEARAVTWAIGFPPFVRFLPLFQTRGYKTIYDCLDEWIHADELGLYFANQRAEEFLTRHVDLVILAMPALAERFRQLQPEGRVGIVRNGIETPPPDNGAPADLLTGDLTLGFWGTLQDYTIDLQALEFVARARPRWAFNLIGQYDLPRSPRAEIERLRALGNVRFFGYIPNPKLIHYGRHFDVCLVPYPDNSFSRGRDSIKLYTYVACEKPIVALHASQLAYAPNVLLAESSEEFLAQIENARTYRVDHSAAREFVQKHSWENSAREFERLVQALPAPVQPYTGVALPATFEDVTTQIRRLQELINELERVAEERRIFAEQLQAHSKENARYIAKLERTHPFVWLKRAYSRLVTR